MPSVVILGGGFGGLAAADELRRIGPDVHVTLVDRGDRFFMGFAKLWDLAGVRPLAEGSVALAPGLEARGVRFVRADVTAVDPVARRVTTSAGDLDADAVLVALGAGVTPRHRELLAVEGAHDVYDAAALPAIHAALDAVSGGRVLVAILGGPFKCPPAPYEAALVVAERVRGRGVSVAISTPQPMTLPVAGPDASRYVASHLEEWGVELLAKKAVSGIADGPTVTFDDGSTLECSLVLGVPACAPLRVLAESGLAGPSGFVEPDRHTLRTSFERVYAVGDCTMIPTANAQLPKAGVFAAAEGVVAARNIAADLGIGSGDRFDGHGYCFLELPGRKVAFVEGNFFAEPAPDVQLRDADEDQFRRKQEYERARLADWLGAD